MKEELECREKESKLLYLAFTDLIEQKHAIRPAYGLKDVWHESITAESRRLEPVLMERFVAVKMVMLIKCIQFHQVSENLCCLSSAQLDNIANAHC